MRGAERIFVGNGLACLLLAGLWAAMPAEAGGGEPSVPPSWLAKAQGEIADAEYEVIWQDETPLADLGAAWQAPNRAHGFRTYFTTGGIRVIPRLRSEADEAPSWQWGLRLARWGRPGRVQAVAPARLTVAGNEAIHEGGAIVERYVNDRRGLEQIFHIGEAPRGRRGVVRLDLDLSGTLSPVIAEDGQAIDFTTPRGAKVLHYGSLRVVDARGVVLPAWMEGFVASGQRGIRLVYDDAQAVYPVTVDPLTTSAVWTAESDQADAGFGYSVATAGDVDGDGYSDVIVGAPFYDNGQADAGRVHVYLGSPSGLAASPAWTVEGDQAGAQLGASVAPAADVDGDGFSDVMVAAPFYDNGQTDEGRAYLHLGSAAGLATIPAWTVEGDQTGAQLGASVAPAGDVDGDGFPDVIIAAPFYDNGQIDEGQAYVYLGSAAGLPANPAWTAESDQAGALFGWSVATAGDVNGDGFSDVIVGAHLYDNGQTDEGRAFVYLGSAAGLAGSAAWTAESDQAGAQLGWSVATTGDVHGDGYSDVIVGAIAFDNGQSDEGRAFVYPGSDSGLAVTPAWTAESDQGSAGFGVSVATAGDVNGDGYSDVIIGAHFYDNGQTDQGRAFVYLGSVSGLAASPAWTAESAQTGAFLGRSVATAGDVNGDGYSDVIVGASAFDNGQTNEGRAFVHLGSASSLAATAAWTAESDQTGASLQSMSVASAGDVNCDGYSDVIAGAPAYDNGQSDEGRAFLYLGSASGLATTAAWTAESDQSGGGFGVSVATAGDINGDGCSDVIVGAPYYDNGQADEGRAFVYLGSGTGLAATPAWTAESDQAGAWFGYSAATAGDVNGDGYSDVVVGAWLYASGGPGSQGRAFVYLGSAFGLAATPAWTAESGVNGAGFGHSVSTAGDVNGDGYSDVVVGAHTLGAFPQTNEGRAFVYLGAAAGLSEAPAWTDEGNQASAFFGWSVSTAGDVNGDGYSDVIVGAHGHDNGQADEGRVYVYHGSAAGLETTAAWITESDQANANYGHSVATAGDVNGDGYSDVVVGAYVYDNGQADEGRAYAYLGSAAGLATTPAWTAESDQGFAHFGFSVATAGDVNRDGYADVLVGAPDFDNGQFNEGRTHLYYGNGRDGLDRAPRQVRADDTAPIALLGKSDAETSFRLGARGRTPSGRGAIRLEWEVKPLESAFDGTGIGTSSARDTGAPDPLNPDGGSATDFNEPVTGLAGATAYRWRSRTASPDPYFPRSPWMSLAGSAVTEKKLRTAGCVDGDGDGFGAFLDPFCPGPLVDCDEADPTVYPGAPELNDGQDNQCPGDPGHGSTDEIGGSIVLEPGGDVCWSDSSGAVGYEVARSTSPDFVPCGILLPAGGAGPCVADPDVPPPGGIFYYLLRATSPHVGSWGQDSDGNERSLSCM
ncbi:MAG TPA: FG-GAP-like repeat-containing protein [Candidatus Polarisedimenticolia bacterium]|nr:FG-GAP-like repeat-containing protein [Candidatus Polarisedimenticolia bacterium]